mgnify:FL=1
MAPLNEYLDYWASHVDDFGEALLEHFALVGMVLLWSLALAAVLTLAVMRSRRAEHISVQLLSAVYSSPSLALFSLLIPVTGLGATTAVLVMVAYNQYLLLRNVLEGLDGIDPDIVEAAVGMGMSPWQVLYRVKLPLAAPMILAGIRLAAISTIGIATIAATINAGGLGTILFSGLRTMNQYKIVGGTLLCALVAVVADRLLKLVERVIVKRTVH